MQRAPDTGPETGGLTTEDLAQPGGREPPPDEEPQATADAPTLPGESTDVRTESSTASAAEEAGAAEEEAPQLLSSEDAEGFRSRWQEIQSRFVDDPRDAVQGADALVAEVMQSLAGTFADHKQTLEEQWNRGDQVDTEGLRMALRHYRAFFNRLLTE
jgi:predicted lipid-binding transport protein (Tim44 family)